MELIALSAAQTTSQSSDGSTEVNTAAGLSLIGSGRRTRE